VAQEPGAAASVNCDSVVLPLVVASASAVNVVPLSSVKTHAPSTIVTAPLVAAVDRPESYTSTALTSGAVSGVEGVRAAWTAVSSAQTPAVAPKPVELSLTTRASGTPNASATPYSGGCTSAGEAAGAPATGEGAAPAGDGASRALSWFWMGVTDLHQPVSDGASGKSACMSVRNPQVRHCSCAWAASRAGGGGAC